MSDPDDVDIEIVTPQFERTDGHTPDDPPSDIDGFRDLRRRTPDELREMGLQPWPTHGIWLFPFEWNGSIPDDLSVVNILGQRMTVSERPDKEDKRFGMLAFGIVPEFEETDS